MDNYRRSPAVGQSHIERQTLALEKIAENTVPKDSNISEVSLERDKNEMLLKGAIGFIDEIADYLMLAVDEPDFFKKGRDIRLILQKMLDFTAAFKRDNR